MPVYATRCNSCKQTKDVRLSFAQYEDVSQGRAPLPCSVCGQGASIEFSPGSIGFIMRDGESGGWASKAMKENGYRAKRHMTMTRREQDHVFKPKLVPNFDGQEAPSWLDAQAEARAKKGDAAAVTYEPLVHGGST